ncbi:unnamed protein product [Heterosigma akashiwo]
MFRLVPNELDLSTSLDRSFHRLTHISIVSTRFQAPESEDFAGDETSANIKQRVFTISQEKDDTKRRFTVSSLINQKISEKDDQFVKIWDKALVEIAEELQDQARRKAVQMPLAEADGSTSGENSVNKTAEEVQLWALVDMMIQSKTLIKKAQDNL